jgi:hypothetical protein
VNDWHGACAARTLRVTFARKRQVSKRLNEQWSDAMEDRAIYASVNYGTSTPAERGRNKISLLVKSSYLASSACHLKF